jgi:outer membrane protein TolC
MAGGVLARVRASRAREAARQLEIDEIKQALGATVEGSYVELEAARQAIAPLQQALEAARANYAQAQARFRTGLGTAVELADAESLLAQSEVNAAVGRFRLATARARFGRAIAENL